MSNRKLYLHVGSDKAGSTAIQMHLAVNKDVLLRNNVLLHPEGLVRGGHQGNFFSDFDVARTRKLVADIDQRPDEQAILFTWEGIHTLPENKLEILGKFLSKYDVTILYYVREQAEIVQTGLLQQIKAGIQPARAIFEPVNMFNTHRNYYNIVKRFEKYFPGCEVQTVYFDRKGFPEGNIVYDFFRRVVPGMDFSEIRINNETVNDSLNPNTAKILAFIEFINPDLDPTRRDKIVDILLAANVLFGKQGNSYFLCQSQVEEIREHFRESNQQLIDEYQVSERLLTHQKPAWNDLPHQDDISTCNISGLDEVSSLILKYTDVAWFDQGNRAKDSLGLFVKGWSDPQKRGGWMTDNEAIIAGRPRFRGISPFDTGVKLSFKGDYFADIEPRSRITINGEDFGEHDLRMCDIQVPLSTLDPPYYLELRIYNEFTKRPCDVDPKSKDRRELSYRLNGLKCSYIRE